MAAKDDAISGVQKQELEESTTCCICTDTYKYPKLLPCGHTFCMDCIQETGLKTSKRPGNKMPCPICRRKFKIPSNGFTGLKHNSYVEGLIRIAQNLDPTLAELTACDACFEEHREDSVNEVPRASMYCIDCKQKLCEECCRHHRKLKLAKNHKLKSMNRQRSNDEDFAESLVSSVCKLHDQEDLKIYCCICKTVVCSICFVENHEGHKGTHVTKAVDDFRKEIASNAEKVKNCISQAETKKSDMTKTKEDIHERFGSLECEIITRRDVVKQVVDRHANALLEELRSKRQSILKEIHIEAGDIDAQLEKLKSYIAYCEKLMTKGSAADICLSAGDLSVRMNTLQEETQPLIEQKLTQVVLCFTETKFEDEDGGNMIGRLQEQRQLKQMIKTKELEEDKKENEETKVEVKTRNPDFELVRYFIEEKLKQNSDIQLSDEEQLINKTLQLKIENRNKQPESVKIKAAPLQVDEEHFASGENSDCIKSEEQPQEDQSEVPNSKPDVMSKKFIVSQMHKEKKTGKRSKETLMKFKSKPDFHHSVTSAFSILTVSYKSLVLYASNVMSVEVKQENIATIRDVDIVVSCINHQLDINGSLADQIIKAAGPDVIAELNLHKNRLLSLQTGDLVHTSAGNMTGLKAIIHVVALAAPLNEQRSRDALTNIFTNCLRYANDELKVKSICLPPICLGLYDTQLVADCFLEAVAMFSSTFDVSSAAKQHQHDQNINYIQLAGGKCLFIRKMIQYIKKRVGDQ